MARSVILGNNGLTVGLNESGLVHDFYYPYVGLENLTTARSQPHHIGIWVDGFFSWISDHEWQKEVKFEKNCLVSSIDLINDRLKIGLHFEDFVDVHHDTFARKVRVRNLSDHKRDVRLFFHQVFQISAEGRADTVMYVPDGHYILDYKGRCSILAYAELSDGTPFDQYSTGNAGIEGKEGTFRDAEDGELSMSAVEHASVDSSLRVSFTLESSETETVRYWLCVSDAQTQLEKLHNIMLNGGFDQRLHATRQHWFDWIDIAKDKIELVDEKYQQALKQSLLVIKAHIDEHGGIIASCDSSIYNYGRDYYSYVWPRDGAYVIWPLIKLGFTKEAEKFFEFCKSIMHEDGYMMHKYQPDRAIGSTWHPLVHGRRKELAIQEDETAIVIFMLSEYEKYSGNSEFVDKMFDKFVVPATEFLAMFTDEETGLPHASYDLWEEKFLTSTYTTAAAYKALVVASKMANDRGHNELAQKWSGVAELINSNAHKLYHEDKGHYMKGFLYTPEDTKTDEVLDISSLFGAYMFNYGPEKYIERTIEAIENTLLDKSPSGGSPRYTNDNYFRSEPAYLGNPWFVTTLWIAQYYALEGMTEKAKKYIDWSLDNTLPSGLLSEQIAPEDSEIRGVTPLIWSHAELINTILDLN